MGLRSRVGDTLVRVGKTFGGSVPQSFREGEAASQMTPASPFSPGQPIGPYDGYDRMPRAHDFVTGYNIATRPRIHERVSFETLRGLVESYDIAQIAIWHRIDSIRALDWKLIAKHDYNGDVADAISIGMEALKRPDRINSFSTWLAKYLYDVLAYDAGALYRMRNRGGKVVGLSVVDGTTIAPLLDYWGNPPQSPAEAFVQYANGLPWNWLTRDDIIYEPFRPVPNSLYGRAPLESIILNANTDLRFQIYFLQRFTEGNLPAAFAAAPDSWSPDQIEQFQAYWDSFMYGDQSRKAQVRWMPGGSKFTWSNEKDFSDQFSQFLMRKTLAAYHTVPSDLGFTECYSEDTECLTDRGWLRYDELQDDDRVATYNPQTHGIEYHIPTHKYVAPYQGDMIHFKNRSQDVLVTPHHRMWAWTQTQDRTPSSRPWREIRAEDLASMSRFGFVGHAVFDAPDIDEVIVPAVESRGRNPVDRRVPMDLWLEFLGYMISEGCVHRQSSGIQHYNVSISQSNKANPEKVPRFTRCLEQLPISWTVRDFERDGCRGWSVGDKSLWTWLLANIGQSSRGKHLPDFFRQLGKRQATILLEALLLGDGTVDARECSTGREYGTMSAQLASDVQELAYKLGYRVTASCNKIGFWRVNITDGRDHQLGHQNVTREPYSGTVWCVEVPHHLFVTRRNGKITVQGNTVNRSSGESQADVVHKVGELPLENHVEGIVDGFLQDDLGLPLEFLFDRGEEQDDRIAQAQADDIYAKLGVIGSSELREIRYGRPEPQGKPVPRFIYSSRQGPIPLASLYAVAGEIDPETGAPVPGSQLPHMAFSGAEGVVPNPPLHVAGLAEQEFGPKAIPPAPPPQPIMGEPVAKEGEAAPGITSETGIYGDPLIRDEDEDDREAAVKSELAAFRRFERARRKSGEWRDFKFEAVDPVAAHRLNDGGRLAVRKAAGEIAVAGLAVLAADTGRVLMLQRGMDPEDPAAGKFEFPGGHVEGSESPLQAAWREFAEETGVPAPPGAQTGTWTSANGIYQGVVWTTESEAAVPVRGGAIVQNPDLDPDGDSREAILWVDPLDLPANPVVRSELLADIDAVMAALGCTPGCCGADCCQDGGCCGGTGGCTCGAAAEVAKADGLPKGPGPRDWPGWQYDLKAAEHWAPLVTAAITAALPDSRLRQLARDYLAGHEPSEGTGKRDLNEQAEAWLRGHAPDLATALAGLIAGILADAYVIGAFSAAAVTGGGRADTGGWQPGDTDAAEGRTGDLGLGDDYASITGSQSGDRAQDIAGGYITVMGRTLADGLQSGADAGRLADSLRQAVSDHGLAAGLVLTVLTAVSSLAAKAWYWLTGVQRLIWIGVLDSRICERCLMNVRSDPVPAGQPFPTGDTEPPIHPGDRCAVVPA